MTPREECREEFEKWAREQPIMLTLRKDGGYFFAPARHAWEGWQAAWNRRPASGEVACWIDPDALKHLDTHPLVNTNLSRHKQGALEPDNTVPLYRSLPGDAVDAARYRALRDSGKYSAASIGSLWGLATGGSRWSAEELDAAVDEAMRGVAE